MDPRVTAAIAAGGGLITRAQALDLGLSPGEVRRLRRTGEWIALRRGVYTTADIWNGLEPFRGQARLMARAVTLTMSRGWVLSHNSAADELGLDTLNPPAPVTHITRPGWSNAWTEHGVSHHYARFTDDQVVERGGLRMLDAARTAVDIARTYGFQHGLVVCDSVLRGGVTRGELVAAYEPMRHWPGIRDAYAAVDLADPGAENPHESLGRELIVETGIGSPRCQFPVETARGTFWVDMIVGNHGFETDGRLKLRPRSAGGFADDPEQTLWDEKLRHRAVADEGLVVTRLVWEDYWGRRREEARRRILADHAESVRRFGPTLDPALAENADRILRRCGGRRPA